jgi:hypothetical protein
MDSFRICKKCGLIQDPNPHVAPWVEPCTNCGNEDIEFVQEREIKYTPPSMCPKCHKENLGHYVYGPPIMMTRYQKEIEEGKIRAAGCELGPDSHHWFCRDCNYEW